MCLVDVPRDATLVVFHSAVLAYLAPADREVFADQVAALGATWISYEAAGVLPNVEAPPPQPDSGTPTSAFLIARDGRRPLAWADPHGAWLERM